MNILKKNYVIFFFFLIILEIKCIKVEKTDLVAAGLGYGAIKAYRQYSNVSNQEKTQARISFLLNRANNRFQKLESKNIQLENLIINGTLLEKIQNNNVTLDLDEIFAETNNTLGGSSSREDDLTNFYSLAGIKGNSSNPEELKRAYYQGVLKLHPDKERDLEKKQIKREQFKVFSSLYEKLTKPNFYNNDAQTETDNLDLYYNTNISLKELIIKQCLDSNNNDIKSFSVKEFFDYIKEKITKIKNSKTIDGNEKNNTNKNYLKLTQSIDKKIIYPLLNTLVEGEKNININITTLIQKLMIYNKEVFKEYLDSFGVQKNNIILNKTSSILNDQRPLPQINLDAIENNDNEDDSDEQQQYGEEDGDYEEEDNDRIEKKPTMKKKNSYLEKKSLKNNTTGNAIDRVDLSFFNTVIDNSSVEKTTTEMKKQIALLSKETISSLGSNSYATSKKQEILKINNDFSLSNDKKILKIENIKKDIEKNYNIVEEEQIKNNLIKLCDIVSFTISEKIIKEKKIDLLLLYTFFVVGRFIEIFINLIEQKETEQFKNLIAIVNILHQYLKVLLSTIQFLKTYPGGEESKVMKIIENAEGENTSYYYKAYRSFRGAKEKVKSGVRAIDDAIGLKDAGTALGVVVLGKTKVGNKLKDAGSALAQKGLDVGANALNRAKRRLANI